MQPSTHTFETWPPPGIDWYYSDDSTAIAVGDSRDLVPQMPRVDLILTDPPYGVDLPYDVWKDDEAGWFKLMDDLIPKLRAGADMVIFPSCQIKRLGWFYTQHPPDWLIAWHKGSPGHVSMIGFNDWEPLIVYGKTPGLCMHDYLSVNNDEKMGNYGHPCPKPLKWAKWLIDRACPEGGTVLEPFLGSGTVLRAAKDGGRRAIGIEISKAYADIAIERMRQEVLDLGV